ncbi:MAG: hypothetical protein HQM08_29475 [Candidatus Riflebacteria bacterium]|nr:hypothetical protein [Candidatus Riflebacteria bacterium]
MQEMRIQKFLGWGIVIAISLIVPTILGLVGCRLIDGDYNQNPSSTVPPTTYQITGMIDPSLVIENSLLGNVKEESQKPNLGQPNVHKLSAQLSGFVNGKFIILQTVPMTSSNFTFTVTSQYSKMKVDIVSSQNSAFQISIACDGIPQTSLTVGIESTLIAKVVEENPSLQVNQVQQAIQTTSKSAFDTIKAIFSSALKTFDGFNTSGLNTQLSTFVQKAEGDASNIPPSTGVVTSTNTSTGTNTGNNTGTGTGSNTVTNTNTNTTTGTGSNTNTNTNTNSGTGTGTGTKTLSGITIATTSITLNVNGTYNLAGITVTANYSNSTNAIVTGSWSGTGVNGTTYTAPASSGTAILSCTYTEGGVVKSANLSVTINAVVTKTLSSVSLSTSAIKLATNGTYNLGGITTTANYSDSTTATVSGAWSGTGVSGTTYTAPPTGGIATVTFTYSEGGVTKTADVGVTIKGLNSITLATTSFVLMTYATYNLGGITVTANYSDSTTAAVTTGTWSGTGVSGTTYTAPGASGNVTVTCSYSEGGVTKTADVAVTIKALSSISLSTSSINVITNGTYNLAGITVTANYSNSSSATVATGTWSGTGVSGTTYTAPPSAGIATITYTYCEGGTCQAASVSVNIRALSSISLATSSIKLLTNATYDLSKIGVTANYSNSTTAAATGTWFGTGVSGTTYTAPPSAGVATITCTYTEGGTTQTASVSVSIKALTGILLSTDTLNLAGNATYSLALITVTANYSDSTSAIVSGTWSGTGVNGTTYTASSTAGVATITCSYIDGGITQIASVTINTTVTNATVSFGGRTVSLPNFALSKIWITGMTGSYAGGRATLVGGTSTGQSYVVLTDGTTKSLSPEAPPDTSPRTFTSITFNPPLPSGVTVQVKSTDTGSTTTIDQTSL